MTKDGHETLSFYLPREKILLYTVKKGLDGVKIASKKLVHKTAEATGGEFTGHRMADEVREILKNQLFHQTKDRKS